MRTPPRSRSSSFFSPVDGDEELSFPQERHYNGSLLADYSVVYREIVKLPHKDRFERWAHSHSAGVGKKIATRVVGTLNSGADHPLHTVFFLWGIAVVFNLFVSSGSDVTLSALVFSEKTLAFAAIGTILLATVWKKLRGEKRPDYTLFQDFTSQIENISTTSERDKNIRSLITRPNVDSLQECDDYVSWHTGFISWLARGGNQSLEGVQDVEGIWEAIGYIIRNISKQFSPSFDESEEFVVVETNDYISDKSHSRVSTAESINDNSQNANWGLLQQSLEDSKKLVLILDAPRTKKKKGASKTRDRSVQPDLYDTPLAHDFLMADSEEKKAAATFNWREVQITEKRKPATREDIAMRITSHAVSLYIHLENAADILHGFLKGVLSHPFVTDRFARNHNFMLEQKEKSFQLVNLLRPAITDGQWHNWRYFYAQDPTVTEAFQYLSPEEQSWMIFTLMSGSDHGKLLALSILQDPRLDLTSLSLFFKTYLREFGAMPREQAREAYKDWKGEYPNERELRAFRIGVTNQARLQLLWLTENSTGRFKTLFENDANIAADILLIFSVDLPDAELINSTYAVSAEKASKDSSHRPIEITYNDGKALHNYWTDSSGRDREFGFAIPGVFVTRQRVVEALMKLVQEKPSVCAYLGEEISQFLRNRAMRHTVPKSLSEGVRLIEQIETQRNAESLKIQFKKYCEHPDTVKNYLRYGIGLNQPWGARTVELFAESLGYRVEVYLKGEKDKIVQLDKEDKRCAPICRLFVGENYLDWAWLSLSYPSNMAPLRLGEPPHPMAVHAQELYWSVSNPEQQEKIAELMDYGHPTIPKKGYKGSSKHLFALNSPENIAAIREGVFQSGSLEALRPQLIVSGQGAETAFEVLAVLLSDPFRGIDYQRAFQKLVNQHYAELVTLDKIEKFLDWLEKKAPLTVNKDMVRARYIAVILLESNPDDVHADSRAQHICKIMNIAYPDKDILTAFHCMYFAFSESENEWVSRRRIFRLTYRHKLLESSEGKQVLNRNNLEFMSEDGQTDLMPVIVAGFKGSLTDLASRKGVMAWADLLSAIISESFDYQDYIDALIERFCTLISEESVVPQQKFNVVATLLSVLHATKTYDQKINLSEKMYQLFEALVKSLGATIQDFQIDFNYFNYCFQSLGVAGQKQSDTHHFEPICLRLAAFLLHESRSTMELGQKKMYEDSARVLISRVVHHLDFYGHVTLLDRMRIGHHLGLLVNTKLYQSKKSKVDVQEHRSMVHKTLFLFFSNTEGLDMAQYKEPFLELCSQAGPTDSDGLAALIEGISKDSQLPEQDKRLVIDRMSELGPQPGLAVDFSF